MQIELAVAPEFKAHPAAPEPGRVAAATRLLDFLLAWRGSEGVMILRLDSIATGETARLVKGLAFLKI